MDRIDRSQKAQAFGMIPEEACAFLLKNNIFKEISIKYKVVFHSII